MEAPAISWVQMLKQFFEMAETKESLLEIKALGWEGKSLAVEVANALGRKVFEYGGATTERTPLN